MRTEGDSNLCPQPGAAAATKAWWAFPGEACVPAVAVEVTEKGQYKPNAALYTG